MFRVNNKTKGIDNAQPPRVCQCHQGPFNRRHRKSRLRASWRAVGYGRHGRGPAGVMSSGIIRKIPTGRTGIALSFPMAMLPCCYMPFCTSRAMICQSRKSGTFANGESKTPGHPERGVTPGVEMTTGAAWAGHSLRCRHCPGRRIAGRKIQSPWIRNRQSLYLGFCGDGCLMEGRRLPRGSRPLPEPGALAS